MQKFSIFLLLLFMITLLTGVKSQDVPAGKKELRKMRRKARDKYLSAGTGILKMSSLDKGTSPLIYSGPVGVGNLQYLVHSGELIKTFDLSAGGGTIKTTGDNGALRSAATGLWFDMRFLYLMKITGLAKEKITWYAGPGGDFSNYSRINFKYGNSAYNYEFMLDAGIASRLEFPFGQRESDFKFLGLKLHRRNRQYRLLWQLYLPVTGFIYRPGFVTVSNFSDPETPLFNGSNLNAGFFKYFRISSEVELFYYLHNGNILKLSYLWRFISYNPAFNKVQDALNGLYFSFVFKFNDKK